MSGSNVIKNEDSLDNTSLDKEMSKEVDDDEGVHVINDHDEGIDLSTENVVGNMNDDLSTEQVTKSYNTDLSNEVDKKLCKDPAVVVEVLAADKEVSTDTKVYINHSGSNAFESKVCDFCGKLPINHYCHERKNGTNR